MSEELPPEETTPPGFPSYACSIGTVIDHRDGGYVIATPDGRTIGIGANGEPSETNVEADIASPPAPVLTVEQIWNDWLAGYITDPVTGIELKANRQARNDFIGQATLLREALDGGALTGADPVTVWDRSNVPHELTVTNCRALLLRYGIAWQTAFNELAP
jgi:hypothetical protein